ncbi:MAG: ABC transporter substrate-binding protein [Candidatus Latescibacterota bacterium]
MQTYLAFANDQGGVHGRRLQLLVEDDGYQPPRAVAAFRKLVDQDRVFCLVGDVGTATTLAIFPLLEREHVPLVMPAAMTSAFYTPPRHEVFAVDPSYYAQAWIILRYLAEVARAPSPRLVTIYQDDDFGQDGLKGLREAAAHYGFPIVAEEGYRRGAVDFSTQVLNLRKAEPTHVVLFTVTRETAAILQEAARAGWHPGFIGANPAADDKIVELAGPAATGYLALQVLDFRGDTEAARRYREHTARYRPGHPPRTYHAYGYYVAQLLVEGLQRAGRDLSRESLIATLETLDHWSDTIGPPVTYGPGVRGGLSTAAFLARADVASRTMVRCTDWIPYDKQPADLSATGE